MTTWLSKAKSETLRRHLLDIPDLMALTETMHATMMPRRGHSSGTKGKRAHPPAPTDLGILDLLDTRPKIVPRGLADDPRLVHEIVFHGEPERRGVLPAIADWVRLADAEMLDAGYEHTPPVDNPTIVSETGWLTRHLDWMIEQQWVTELADEVGKIHARLLGVLDEGRPEYRPRCKCGARMHDEGSHFTCSACGADVREQAMDHRTALAKDRPMTAYDFAPFGILPERIRKWVERGLLAPALDEHSQQIMRGTRLTYWPMDVLRLADERAKAQ